ncbi:hypothetical protein Tco_1041138 [Tanacetum coccineum]|uniref:Uncharacterized protein n=1 Tax=Tanacetum coccineum TaxID=301880 RepID=A0ABQ5GFA8_9ASTR
MVVIWRAYLDLLRLSGETVVPATLRLNERGDVAGFRKGGGELESVGYFVQSARSVSGWIYSTAPKFQFSNLWLRREGVWEDDGCGGCGLVAAGWVDGGGVECEGEGGGGGEEGAGEKRGRSEGRGEAGGGPRWGRLALDFDVLVVLSWEVEY